MLEKHAVLMILLVNLVSERKNMFEEVLVSILIGKKINKIEGLKEGGQEIIFICDTKEVYIARGRRSVDTDKYFISSIVGDILGVLDKHIVSTRHEFGNVVFANLPSSDTVAYSYSCRIVADDGNQLEITWTSISKEEKNTENDHIYFVRMKNVEGRQ